MCLPLAGIGTDRRCQGFPITKPMTNRRDFLVLTGCAGLAEVLAGISPQRASSQASTSASSDRTYWLSVLDRLSLPILENLSRRQLKREMPVEAADPADRVKYTHLEAFGRLFAGIGPWLGLEGLHGAEATQQQKIRQFALASLDAATDPASPDFMNFNTGAQPVVDAAFLSQGLMRANVLSTLDGKVRKNLLAALKSSRQIPTPSDNNWVMFAAMVEAALHILGEPTIPERFEGCVRRMLSWYKGDGVYGDGEFFHFDYYNSFVIHPMLLDALAILKERNADFASLYATQLRRARRYAEIQERLIAPDASFPVVGRSVTYRFGAFHALAQAALLHQLPETLEPAQVRNALSAVMRKIVEAPATFDNRGWLTIGFYGHQPSLAERYISTGSLYLCAVALLPLGLPPEDGFWSSPARTWTSQRIWSGAAVAADHALSER
jgi:hypothetical protein